MIRLIFFLLIILAAAWVGITLSQDPGYLLITINQWTIETTLGVAIIALLIFTYLLHLLLLLINKFIKMPSEIKNWQKRRKIQRAQAKTRQGLIEFSEGYWNDAKNHLIKALPNTDTPLLNYLTAARAAQELGDNKLRDDYLREAQQSMPEAKIAVELTQAQLQLANKQWEQALATLKHLQHLNPKHHYVLKLLMHLYEEIRDWEALIELLPELKRHNVITTEEYKILEKRAFKHALIECIKHNQDSIIKNFINTVPKNLKHDPDLIAVYCEYLLNQQEYETAEHLLRKELKLNFNEQLIALYGQIKNNKAQLKFVEGLSKQHPHSANLFLTLAGICKEDNLWGKAKTYLEESIKLKPTQKAYRELGLLLEKLNDEQGAKKAYKEGLLLD